MKLEFSISESTPQNGILKWLEENQPSGKRSKLHPSIEQHYHELIDDFKEFLNTTDHVIDNNDNQLKPIDIYHAIEYYKIRIRKLLMILDVKLYKTLNVNKETQVKYIVMRAYWIDDEGKPYRKFSKNLGAEKKVLINGRIPVKVLESVEEYITTLMWDQYYYEYIDNSIAGYDKDGNLVIPTG